MGLTAMFSESDEDNAVDLEVDGDGDSPLSIAVDGYNDETRFYIRKPETARALAARILKWADESEEVSRIKREIEVLEIEKVKEINKGW